MSSNARKLVFGVALEGLTQTSLCSHRGRIEALNFVFKKRRGCTIHEKKTKVLISCTDDLCA